VVTAADTGKPLPGVFLDIQADGPNGNFYGEALTDEQGRYWMAGPAGLRANGQNLGWLLLTSPKRQRGKDFLR
jgi:hypothetical protein